VDAEVIEDETARDDDATVPPPRASSGVWRESGCGDQRVREALGLSAVDPWSG
jgi:hypothetical protein